MNNHTTDMSHNHPQLFKYADRKKPPPVGIVAFRKRFRRFFNGFRRLTMDFGGFSTNFICVWTSSWAVSGHFKMGLERVSAPCQKAGKRTNVRERAQNVSKAGISKMTRFFWKSLFMTRFEGRSFWGSPKTQIVTPSFFFEYAFALVVCAFVVVSESALHFHSHHFTFFAPDCDTLFESICL